MTVLEEVALKEIVPDPNQPRKNFDDAALKELENSLKKHGVLQPVLLRRVEGGKHVIVAGERRFRAAKSSKMKTIPAIFTDGNSAEISLVENLIRQNLSPLEEAEAIQRLKDEMKYSNKTIAEFLGKSPSIISETLSLNKLPDGVKKDLQELPDTPKRTLIKIARLPGVKQMAGAWRRYKNGALSKSEEPEDEDKPDKRKDGINVLMRFMKSASGSLEKMDYSLVTEENKGQVRAELEKLSGMVQESLKQLGGSEPGK